MKERKLAVCLYKYFPFGGLARDFLRIMTICHERGYKIDVFVMEWQGEIPAGFNVHIMPTSGWTNHGKVASYIKQITPKLNSGDYDLVIGFNKIPHLDLYYAADPCYLDRVKSQSGYLFKQLSGRVRFYTAGERAVFGAESSTISLMISDVQCELFKQHYAIPESRLIMLPPGIDEGRRRPDNWQSIRQEFRQEFSVPDEHFILLMVGTGFKTKGLDRAIIALADLPQTIRKQCHLFVVGDGDTEPYQRLAKQYGVAEQVCFFGGRTDVPRFLLGADVLLHPARKDNTGTVILEAIVAGLPVLVTDVCGYAKYVTQAQAGLVVSSPFNQADFAGQLMQVLQQDSLLKWSKNALDYAASEDLYSMPEKVADIIDQMVESKDKHD